MACLKKRGTSYQIQFYAGGKQRRIGLGPIPHQIAREKLRQFESARLRGDDLPFPTRTPVPDVLAAYVAHIRTFKTPKSAQTDIYYLREMFGPVCTALQITSRTITPSSKKRPATRLDGRRQTPLIKAPYFEAITTPDVSRFISTHKQSRGLAPKTANRYREIAVWLFNWAVQQRGTRLPGNRNPAAATERYPEPAPKIRYLSLQQIDDQLQALDHQQHLKTMVAVLIYAGLRREELLWLTRADVIFGNDGRPLIHVRAKTISGQSWQPKTKCNRTVPVSRTLQPLLAQYQKCSAQGNWLFPTKGDTRWDPDNFSATLRTTNARAGLTWTALDYRHTFGSQLAQRGVSLYKIATLMGNSPDVCRRHYAALAATELANDVEFASHV